MPRENYVISGQTSSSTYCFFGNIKISPKEQYAIIVKNDLTPDEVAFRIQGNDHLKWGPSEIQVIRDISDNGYLSPITVSQDVFNKLKADLKELNELNKVSDDDDDNPDHNPEESRSMKSAEIFVKVFLLLRERQLQEQAQNEHNLIEVINKANQKIHFRLNGEFGLGFTEKEIKEIADCGYSNPLVASKKNFNALKMKINQLRDIKVQKSEKKQTRKEIVEIIVSYGKRSKLRKQKSGRIIIFS